MRRIAVVTVERSDYGVLRPLLFRLRDHLGVELQVIASGSHGECGLGETRREIRADGMDIRAEVPGKPMVDALSTGKNMAWQTEGVACALADLRPDILVVLGDRFETHAAVVAAQPFRIPIAHIGGGALTLGAINDVLRHSITKMSHFHFVETKDHQRRVLQLGEPSDRVALVGPLSLDTLSQTALMSPDNLCETFGISLRPPPILVTYHSQTRSPDLGLVECDAMLGALAKTDAPIIFTYPNADPGHHEIIERIEAFAAAQAERTSIVESFGQLGYFSMMARATMMVGNSSSGIIEAASFALPVVNIGGRQEGRKAGRNVIHCEGKEPAISEAIELAKDPAFRHSLRGMANPYGVGEAATRILNALIALDIGPETTSKLFRDLPEC